MHQMSLARQVDLVFRVIKDELAYLSSGIIFIQIRNNIVGKFGIKHDPIESNGGKIQTLKKMLSEEHLEAFRKLGIESLKHKQNWTHGEIWFEFALRQNTLTTSIQFESNYNMASATVNAKSARPL